MEKKIREYVMITLGMFVVELGVYFFIVPSGIIMGTAPGIAMAIQKIIPLSISLLTLIINGIFFTLGRILVGKEFSWRTVYLCAVGSVFLYIFELLYPSGASLTGEYLIDAVIGILLIGAGQAFLFSANASSGGLDIAARIVNKYFHIEFGMAVTIVGVISVCLSYFVSDLKSVILGLLLTYFNGIVVNRFVDGFSRKKRVCIISKNYEQFEDYIIHGINRGVTIYRAIGGYKKEEHPELCTILDNREWAKLRAKIPEIDPDAFVTVASISEVSGIWNKGGMAEHIGMQ